MSKLYEDIKLKTFSVRRLPSPLDEQIGPRGEIERGVKRSLAVANCADIPESLEDWRSINPRHPKLTSNVAKKIQSSLEDDPSSFLLKNRGITIMCETVSFDEKTQTVTLKMSNPSIHGLLDGGHTFEVIKERNGNMPSGGEDAFVTVEIISGVSDLERAVSIVEARNTSTQVKDQSIQELLNKYADIKNVLDGQPYAKRIAYKEHELLEDGSKKDIDIREILSYLLCFDINSFDSSTHPVIAYSSKTAVVEHFKNNGHTMSELSVLLPKILELRDTVYHELPDAYNEARGKFGALTGVTEVSGRKRMRPEELPFIAQESNYRIPSGFIYPVLAGFRNAIERNTKGYDWKVDPVELFRELKVELAKTIADQAKEFRNPNKLGKDKGTWDLCYLKVDNALLKRLQ